MHNVSIVPLCLIDCSPNHLPHPELPPQCVLIYTIVSDAVTCVDHCHGQGRERLQRRMGVPGDEEHLVSGCDEPLARVNSVDDVMPSNKRVDEDDLHWHACGNRAQ